jgi:hypothetical protein
VLQVEGKGALYCQNKEGRYGYNVWHSTEDWQRAYHTGPKRQIKEFRQVQLYIHYGIDMQSWMQNGLKEERLEVRRL